MKLVDKAQSQIKDMVLEGRYNENGYLPSEGELCEMLSVSRSTIREAVKSLEIRGFVKRIHGKGILVQDSTVDTFTRSMSDMFVNTSITLDEILEIRKIIEVPAAGLAAERANEEDLKQLEKIVVALEKSESIGKDYNENDLNFHLTLVNASRNKALSAITKAYTPIIKKLIYKATANNPDDVENVKHYHRHILTAIKSGNSDKAKDMMKEHLFATATNTQL